jgi:hypothetical protein
MYWFLTISPYASLGVGTLVLPNIKAVESADSLSLDPRID